MDTMNNASPPPHQLFMQLTQKYTETTPRHWTEVKSSRTGLVDGFECGNGLFSTEVSDRHCRHVRGELMVAQFSRYFGDCTLKLHIPLLSA